MLGRLDDAGSLASAMRQSSLKPGLRASKLISHWPSWPQCSRARRKTAIAHYQRLAGAGEGHCRDVSSPGRTAGRRGADLTKRPTAIAALAPNRTGSPQTIHNLGVVLARGRKARRAPCRCIARTVELQSDHADAHIALGGNAVDAWATLPRAGPSTNVCGFAVANLPPPSLAMEALERGESCSRQRTIVLVCRASAGETSCSSIRYAAIHPTTWRPRRSSGAPLLLAADTWPALQASTRPGSPIRRPGARPIFCVPMMSVPLATANDARDRSGQRSLHLRRARSWLRCGGKSGWSEYPGLPSRHRLAREQAGGSRAIDSALCRNSIKLAEIRRESVW